MLKQVASKAVLRVIVLAFAAFIFNTTEFIPVALLSDIAKSFNISLSTVGWMITIYAWMVALLSLPLMLFFQSFERKKLLMAIFAIFIASHILSACAWNFPVLLISRIGVATSHAIFWSITAALAMRLAPASRKAQALGLLSMGTALATVLGLPIGRIINELFSWRITFASVGIIAAVVMVILWFVLPKLPSQNGGDLKSVPMLFKRPRLVCIFLLTVAIVSAHFTAFSYIEPFSLEIVHLSTNSITAMLLIFGFAGIIGSLLFNRYQVAYPDIFLFIAMAMVAASLLFMQLISHSIILWFTLLIIWGIGITGIGLSMQYRVLSLAADATDIASSIYSGIFNIGIGGGALIGAIVVQHLGLVYIGYIGLAFSLLAFAIFIWANYRYPRKQALADIYQK